MIKIKAAGLPLFSALLSTAVSSWAQSAPSTPDETASSDEIVVLSPFEVTSSSDVGYLATNSTSATRFAAATRDLPISIDVITREMMNDQVLTDLNSTLESTVPGLQPGGIPRQSIIRGMASDYPLRNGVPTFGTMDMAVIDRVEVVKGAAAVLYGVTQPGGVRNMQSKMPTLKPKYSITQRVDSDDRMRTEVEMSGPLLSGGKLGYRLIGVYDEWQKYYDFQLRRDQMLYPAIVWQPFKGTKVMLEYDYKYFTAGGTGFPQLRLLTENFNRFVTKENSGPDLPYSLNRQGPNAIASQRMRLTNLVIDQQINSVWSMRAAYAWQPYERYQPTFDQQTFFRPGATTFNKYAQVAAQRFRQEFARLDFLATVKRDKFTNRTLIGGDYLWRLDDTSTFRDARLNAQGNYALTLYTVNLLEYNAPTYANNWLYDFANFTSKNPLFARNRIWNSGAGAYLVDQFSFNRERTFLLGGLRYDNIKTVTRADWANFRASGTSTDLTATRVSPQIGVSHRLSDSVSYYFNYSTSVYPNTAVNPDGTGFPPQYGEGWDTGLKVEALDSRISGSVSVFETLNKNLPISDPNAANDPSRVGYFVLQGQAKSQGVDLSFTLTPLKQWQIVTGYTYLEAYNTNTNVQLPNTARHNGNLWTRYAFNRGVLKGLAVGGGARWRTKSYTGTVGAPFNPERALVDAFASYRGKLFGHRYSIQLNVKNVFNKRFINDLPGGHMFGDGRLYILSTRLEY